MVEVRGIEPLAPCLQSRCSPAEPTGEYWAVEILLLEAHVTYANSPKDKSPALPLLVTVCCNRRQIQSKEVGCCRRRWLPLPL